MASPGQVWVVVETVRPGVGASDGEVRPAEVSLEMVEQYFRVLEKAGVVAINDH